jgi:hypothetical protein
LINHLKSTLLFYRYSKKLFNYSINALKSKQNIRKSSHKQSKALKKYSLNLLFSIFRLRYRTFFNPNPML